MCQLQKENIGVETILKTLAKMISYEQAKKHLENVLKLPADWEITLQKDPLEFLGLYMRHHATRIPFQVWYIPSSIAYAFLT